ncbi:hypothetical protein B9P99_00425 [Candidatus Marsarchaeota G1 archaeon OSP_B]|uniref:Uncharacterized protein n=3 Tax=Candidatus Marsarchaeota group 1 TaxID=2203770 RepID=A0A2R6AA37_9ARCH|nr:MAG: hypothetical protein B9Q01_05410 [Candidatus Marsarchaeota G1 archaeon OSP_D]PSN88307.1 MAG: hypothetical protein B9Q00_05910 [Candidatus Marsarchaeota G1 archaeon OSP_C]PSN96369.1 MAG: hypothetical protein B9P99_00425 [Candidatus Marsarchaeota G1 archaeon OSP_B]
MSSELGQEIKYAVLMAKKETLIKRDSQRENKMGERVLQVYEELKKVDAKHVIYTDELTIEQVANEILMQERFKLSRA